MSAERADARRNYERILAVAMKEVAANGADASLEQIARTAGVGSATVRRHFPGRRALLEAVFHERTMALCTRADELAEAADARAALLEWLGAFTAYAASARGMAAVLSQEGLLDAEGRGNDACSAQLLRACRPLLRRAQRAGAVAPDVAASDLITLVTGIALATEHHPDAAAEAERLLGLVVAGVSPSAAPPGRVA